MMKVFQHPRPHIIDDALETEMEWCIDVCVCFRLVFVCLAEQDNHGRIMEEYSHSEQDSSTPSISSSIDPQISLEVRAATIQ